MRSPACSTARAYGRVSVAARKVRETYDLMSFCASPCMMNEKGCAVVAAVVNSAQPLQVSPSPTR